MCVCVSMCMCVCVCVFMHASICVCVCVCVSLYLHLHLVIQQTLLSKATYKGENSQAKSNKKHGVTINTTLHENLKNNDLEKRKKKCRNVTAEVQVKR